MTRASSLRTGLLGLGVFAGMLMAPSFGIAQEEASDPCELPRVDGSEPSDEQEPIGERLERCGGVLEPPPVGDEELLGPAPDPTPGTTPIIPPGDVPIQ